MPVVAKNRHHPDSASNAQTTLPRPSSLPAPGARRTSRARIEATPDPDWQSVEPLLDHFNREDEQEQANRAAQRKAKRAHRPLQLSWPAGVAATLLLSHLVALLWLHGSTLAARNRNAELSAQILHARNDIERTKEKIARRASAARIDQWARERGWRKATQPEFDDVTKPATARWNMAPAESAARPDDASSTASDGENAGDGETVPRVEIEVQGEGEIR